MVASRETISRPEAVPVDPITAAGVENILWHELVDSPVVLTNMQRLYAHAISERVMALIMALTRRLPQYALQTREHQWKQ